MNSKYSDTTQRQKELYYQFRLRFPKDMESKIRQRAKAESKSINDYILDCIQEHEQKLNTVSPDTASPAQKIETAIRLLNLCKSELETNSVHREPPAEYK